MFQSLAFGLPELHLQIIFQELLVATCFATKNPHSF
jgi:hypothetical protein